MPTDVTADVRGAVTDSAALVLADAQTTVAVRTGQLRSSLSSKVSRDGLTARVGVIGKRARTKAFYARFVEFGTRSAPAKPFLFPAIERNRKRIFGNMRTAVDRALRRVSRG